MNIKRIKLQAIFENLAEFKKLLTKFLKKQKVDVELSGDIELGIEELLVNIINYSYSSQIGEIELQCWCSDNVLVFKIIDNGIPFDATSAASPELERPLEEHGSGGMGIYLAQEMLHELQYERKDGCNILTAKVFL